jgi:hypothetical protein
MMRGWSAAVAALILVTWGAGSASAAPTTAITSVASSAEVGEAIGDVATLSGATADAGGTITFQAWGPSSTSDCSGNPTFTSTVNVSGPGNYTSDDFTPSTAGNYYWIATYSGEPESDNTPVAGACGDPGETSTAAKRTTALATAASSASIGAPVHDMATLSGATAGAGGTLSFSLYGPSASPGCAAFPIYTHTVNVTGSGEYGSGNFTPSAVGSYYWVAFYSGDVNNVAAFAICGASGETSAITIATPTLSHASSPDVSLGGSVVDTATLAGGANPTGQIEFALYGPGDPTCSRSPDFTSMTPVSGAGEYESLAFSPSALGAYTWFAEYKGDAKNAAVSTCGGARGTVTITKHLPTMTTQASADVRLGGGIRDTATLGGGQTPSGSIVFRAYGPDDPTCSAPAAFTSDPVPVSGAGEYGSPDFTPKATGVYRWIAGYSGDESNESVIGGCGEVSESVTVSPAPVAAPGETAVTGTSPVVPVACAPIEPVVGNYSPRPPVIASPPTKPLPGVRARLRVAQASDQQVAATLRFRWNGRARTVSLGERTLGNPGTANLRLTLPSKWRGRLPVGTKVVVVLRITSTPQAARGCAEPLTTSRKLHTRVARVLSN